MSEVRHYKPPRLAEALLGWLLSDALWQTPLGDFEEYYNEVAAKRGVPRARAWYWGQVLKLFPDRLYEKTYWGTIMLTNYLKIAFRNLRKHKGYAAINIFGLALGMACCILILLFVQYELSFDRFHTKAHQVYRLVEKQTFSGRSPEHVGLTMGVMGQAMVNEYPELTNYVRFYGAGNPLARYEDKQLSIGQTFYADSSVFEMFDFELMAGDPATALDEPNSIVLTEEAARRFFEEEIPVGFVLQANDTEYRVTGVLRDVPENSHLQFKALYLFQHDAG